MKSPAVHGSFTIERTYTAAPERVFAAWADIETKARWFTGPPEKWKLVERKLDFRVGGTEILHGEFTSGVVSIFAARYHAIIPNERLIYVYDMQHEGRHLSVSLATVEFEETKSGGTRMTFTEQAVYPDGEDGTKSREEGTSALLENLRHVVE